MVWFFERGTECLTLDVCQNAAAFEVHLKHPNGTRTLEFAGTAQQLVERMDAIPHALMAAGWQPRPQLEFASPVSRANSNDRREICRQHASFDVRR